MNQRVKICRLKLILLTVDELQLIADQFEKKEEYNTMGVIIANVRKLMGKSFH